MIIRTTVSRSSALTNNTTQTVGRQTQDKLGEWTDGKEAFMNRDRKMILGYLVGGLLVMVFMPSIVCVITSLCDRVYRIEIIQNAVIRWIILMILLVIGFAYGIWSVIIQNTVGQGGPVEIGNIEISPKNQESRCIRTL